MIARVGVTWRTALAVVVIAIGFGPLMPALPICAFAFVAEIAARSPTPFEVLDFCGTVLLTAYVMGWKIAGLAAVLLVAWSLVRPPGFIAVLASAVIAALCLDLAGETDPTAILLNVAAAAWAALCCWLLFGLLVRKYLIGVPAIAPLRSAE